MARGGGAKMFLTSLGEKLRCKMGLWFLHFNYINTVTFFNFLCLRIAFKKSTTKVKVRMEECAPPRSYTTLPCITVTPAPCLVTTVFLLKAIHYSGNKQDDWKWVWNAWKYMHFPLKDPFNCHYKMVHIRRPQQISEIAVVEKINCVSQFWKGNRGIGAFLCHENCILQMYLSCWIWFKASINAHASGPRLLCFVKHCHCIDLCVLQKQSS